MKIPSHVMIYGTLTNSGENLRSLPKKNKFKSDGSVLAVFLRFCRTRHLGAYESVHVNVTSRSTQNNFMAVEGDHNARLKQHRDHLTREK